MLLATRAGAARTSAYGAAAARGAAPLRPRLASPPLGRLSTRFFSDSQFDVFAKLKDGTGEADGADSKKRKPSDKVLRLVDEIMSLSLIEAADLCDLCQEKLAERSGFSAGAVPGRAPFPHPMAMFGMPGGMPMGVPMGGMPMQGMAAPGMAAAPAAAAAAPAEAAAAEAPAAEAEAAPAAKAEKVKAVVTVRLSAFDEKKKIAVIKEVRAITGLGLKESKDFVESLPKVLGKGVEREKAEEMKAKVEAAGGTVALE